MIIRRSSLLTLLLLASLAPAVKADLLYETSFEPPTFVTGRPVDGQDGWVAINGRNAGVVSTANPRSGLQALQVNGDQLELVGGLLRGTYARILDYDPLARGTPIIDVQADLRLDGPSTNRGGGPDDDLISANLTAFGYTAAGVAFRIAELVLSSNGNAYAFAGTQVYQFGTAINLGQYYTAGLRVDFASRTTQFFLDGRLLGALPFSPTVASNVFRDATTRVLALNDPSFNPGPYRAYFDNYSVVAVVPEPSSLALTGFGVLCLLGHGWRRRKPVV